MNEKVLTTFEGEAFDGRLHVSCMPGSSVFDGDDVVMSQFERLHEDERPLFVAMLVPDDEALRLRARTDSLEQRSALRDEYEQRGFDVHQVIIDGLGDDVRTLLKQHVAEAIEALAAGRHVVAHCHSGMGRGSVFALSVAARLHHGNDADAAQRRETLEWVHANVSDVLLVKKHPQAFFVNEK
jgi:predicted protein tyrosine phosphatase